MNCLELRRLKLADPRHLAGPALEHMMGCETCRAFARRIDEQEVKLVQQILVAPPEGLADRVLLRVRDSRRAPQRRPLRLAALAAAVLLTLALSLTLRPDETGLEAARIAIAHVEHEPESFTTHRQVSHGDLRRVALDSGGQLAGSLGSVRYLRKCPVPGGLGWHLVMETHYGPVTVILVPTQSLLRGGSARSGKWLARSRPAGRGYYVVVADNPAGLEEADQRVRGALLWTRS